MTHQLIIPGRLPGLNEYIEVERTNRKKGGGGCTWSTEAEDGTKPL